MKRLIRLLVLASLVTLVLSACAPQGLRASFVQLPDTLKADITALVLVIVSWLFMKLLELVPALKFLEEFRVPLAMALASQLIGLIEVGVPDAYGQVAIIAIQLILAVVALFLGAQKLKDRGVKAFR